MPYALISAILFAALYATSTFPVRPELSLPVALATGVLFFIAIYVPRRFAQYTLHDEAPTVLTKLMERAAAGTIAVFAAGIFSLLWIGQFTNPTLLGEVYIYTLAGVFLFLGVGEVLTNHVMYLQQTHQYNSTQLFGVLMGLGLLLFVLMLYFLAFDLAQPPNLHNYVRDMVGITFVLVGYGRAVFLMAHH